MSKEISERERLISDLRQINMSQDKDSKVLQERLRKSIEAEVELKYAAVREELDRQAKDLRMREEEWKRKEEEWKKKEEEYIQRERKKENDYRKALEGGEKERHKLFDQHLQESQTLRDEVLRKEREGRENLQKAEEQFRSEMLRREQQLQEEFGNREKRLKESSLAREKELLQQLDDLRRTGKEEKEKWEKHLQQQLDSQKHSFEMETEQVVDKERFLFEQRFRDRFRKMLDSQTSLWESQKRKMEDYYKKGWDRFVGLLEAQKTQLEEAKESALEAERLSHRKELNEKNEVISRYEREIATRDRERETERIELERRMREQWDVEEAKLRGALAQELNQSFAEHQKAKVELTRRYSEIEKELQSRQNDEIALREHLQELEKETFQEALEKEYQEKVEKLSQSELEVERQVMNAFKKAQKMLDLRFANHQQRLTQYQAHLLEMYQEMVESYRQMIDEEFEEKNSKISKEMERELRDSKERHSLLLEEQSIYREKINSSFLLLKNELEEMRQNCATLEREAAALRGEKEEIAVEWSRKLDQKELEHARKVEQIQRDLGIAIQRKDRELLLLQEELATKERKTKMELEKQLVESETRMRSEYQQIQLEFEKEMIANSQKQKALHHQREMEERISFEKEIRMYYEQLLAETDQRFQEDFTKKFREFEKEALEQRRVSDKQREEFFSKVLERHHEISSALEEERKSFEDKMIADYERIISQQNEEMQRLIQLSQAKRLDEWKLEEERISEREKLEREVEGKYSTFIKLQKEKYEEGKRAIETALRKELAQRDNLLLQQEKNFQEMLEEHEKQMRERLNEMMTTHQESLQKEQKLRSASELELMRKKVEMEEERAVLSEKLWSKCEEEVKEKYETLLKNVEENWSKECQMREQRSRRKLQHHYESLLQAKEEQLEQSLRLYEEIDKGERERWADLLAEIKSSHQKLMQSLEDKLRKKYEAVLREYEEEYLSQLHRKEEAWNKEASQLQADFMSLHPSKEEQKSLQTLKASVERLWKALGTDPESVELFQRKLNQAAPDTHQMSALYEKECQRLTAQLPLIQLISRREFLKHRLEAVEHDSTKAIEVKRELGQLTQQLRGNLADYEHTHHETFLYKGKPYQL